jgi:hypothetical protein
MVYYHNPSQLVLALVDIRILCFSNFIEVNWNPQNLNLNKLNEQHYSNLKFLSLLLFIFQSFYYVDIDMWRWYEIC